ncbi:unnamed protein product [Clonostachys rhizophaga]|uniref:Uncharacterized protein n=1 Tax=Clonostachys rhizophaga TaxID=160324 RepID=A0A9N9VC19_9HYPO|nr:unnamed protein product [Clonostachys rhizophaga]
MSLTRSVSPLSSGPSPVSGRYNEISPIESQNYQEQQQYQAISSVGDPQQQEQQQQEPQQPRQQQQGEEFYNPSQNPAGNVQPTHPDRTPMLSDGQEGFSRGQVAEKTPPEFVKGGLRIETIIADVLTILIPIALLIFASILISKNGKETSIHQIEQWQNAASVLSTFFPLFFSAVVGRLMMQLGRWKLERGVTVETLEQLTGSRTFFGAVITQIRLRSLSVLAVPLVLLWAFSPVGSQALTRLVQPRQAIVTESSRMTYFDTIGTAPSDSIGDGVMGNEWWYSMERMSKLRAELDARNTLYGSMLTAPRAVKQSSMDSWGNIKIPFLANDQDSSWQAVAANSDRPYSSLVGLPFANISSGNNTFEIESTYVALECDDLELWELPVGSSNSSQSGYLNATYIAALGGGGVEQPAPNGTFQGFSIDRGGNYDSREASWSVGIDRLINEKWLEGFEWGSDGQEQTKRRNTLRLFENEQGIDIGPTRISFQSYVPQNTTENPEVTQMRYHGTHCTVKQKYVESKVDCEKTSSSSTAQCSVTAQRPSQRQSLSENLTILNWPQTWLILSKYWPLASAPSIRFSGYASHDLTLQYLVDPDASLLFSSAAVQLEPSKIDKKDLSTRLSQVLNTYIQLSSAAGRALEGSSLNGDGSNTQEADSQVGKWIVVYSISTVWTVFCILSIILLLASGVAGVVFAHLAVSPAVFGYATAALRKNNMYLSKASETMDGMELARELKKRRVCYGWSENDLSTDGVTGIGELLDTGRLEDTPPRV